MKRANELGMCFGLFVHTPFTLEVLAVLATLAQFGAESGGTPKEEHMFCVE